MAQKNPLTAKVPVRSHQRSGTRTAQPFNGAQQCQQWVPGGHMPDEELPPGPLSRRIVKPGCPLQTVDQSTWWSRFRCPRVSTAAAMRTRQTDRLTDIDSQPTPLYETKPTLLNYPTLYKGGKITMATVLIELGRLPPWEHATSSWICLSANEQDGFTMQARERSLWL